MSGGLQPACRPRRVAANDACVYVIKGCMAPAAGNFDSLATTNDRSFPGPVFSPSTKLRSDARAAATRAAPVLAAPC